MEKDDYQKYLEQEKSKNSTWAKISKQITPAQLVVFILVLLGGNYLMTQGKIESSYFWIAAIAVIGVIIFLTFKPTNDRKLIPEHVIKQIAYEALMRKRAIGNEIPFDSKIKMTLVGEAIYEQDMLSGSSGIIKRDVGFQIIRKAYVQTGVIGIQPYTGEVMGIRWEKTGYGGKSSPNRLIIPVGVVDQFGDKKD